MDWMARISSATQPIRRPSRDIWGPSKNTLLYIQDSTLQVAANGYALQMNNKKDVHQAVFDFTTAFTALLKKYENKKYPINSAVEIRVTSLDPAKVAMGSSIKAERPLISALAYDSVAAINGWDVAVWIDVLTIPGTNFHADRPHRIFTTQGQVRGGGSQDCPGHTHRLGRARRNAILERRQRT